MSDVLPPLGVEIRANANPLFSEFDKVTKATKQMTTDTTGEASKIGSVFEKMGNNAGGGVGSGFLDNLKKFIVPIGGLIAGFGVGEVVNKSVESFETMAGGVKSLGRIIGGTTDTVSGLSGAFKLSGVDGSAATTMLGRLSRALVSAGTDTDKTSALAQKLGVDFLDANGKVKPMADLLPGISDTFKNMPNGAEKTALAMQLFGRNGAAMLPFLNQGSAGIEALTAKANEMGLTISGPAMDAFSAASLASRNFGSQMDGLKTTLGGALMPIMDSMQAALYNGLSPAIQQLTDFISSNQATFEELGKVLGGAITDILKSLMPVVMDLIKILGPILIGVVKGLIPIIEQLGKTVGPLLGGMLQTLMPVLDGLMKTLGPIFGNILKELMPLLGDLFKTLGPMMGQVLQALVPVLDAVMQAFGKIFIALEPLIPVLLDLLMAILPVLPPLLLLAEKIVPILAEVLTFLATVLTFLAKDVIEFLVIPTINAFVAIIDWMVGMFTDGGKTMKETMDNIGQFFTDGFNGIAKFVTDVWNGLMKGLGDGFKGIADFFKVVGKGISDWWGGFWNGLVSAFGTIFGAIGDIVSGVFKAIGNYIIDSINGLLHGLNFFIDGVNVLLDGLKIATGGSIKLHVNHISDLPHFDVGGTIPGNMGAPLLMVGHGGEEVLSRDMLAGRAPITPAVQNFVDTMSKSGGATKKGGDTIINVSAQTNATPVQIASTVGWQLRMMG